MEKKGVERGKNFVPSPKYRHIFRDVSTLGSNLAPTCPPGLLARAGWGHIGARTRNVP